MPFLRHGGFLATTMNITTIMALASAPSTENAEVIAIATRTKNALEKLTAVMTLPIGAIMTGRGKNVHG